MFKNSSTIVKKIKSHPMQTIAVVSVLANVAAVAYWKRNAHFTVTPKQLSLVTNERVGMIFDHKGTEYLLRALKDPVNP